VESPCRQDLLFAEPLPSSVGGTTPPARSAFDEVFKSTYCLVAACIGAVGLAGMVRGPVMVSPPLRTKLPPPVLATDASTYALFTACPACVGEGRTGATANCFVPVIVWLPLMCTTFASAVFTNLCVGSCSSPGVATALCQ